MANKWTVEQLQFSEDWFFTNGMRGVCFPNILTQVDADRIAAILNGEPEPKVEGPWRVTEFSAHSAELHRWVIGGDKFNSTTAILYEKEGFTRDDAELLTSRRNAREAQAKLRYGAVLGSGDSWYIYDYKLK